MESTDPVSTVKFPSNCANRLSGTSRRSGFAVAPSSAMPRLLRKRPLTLASKASTASHCMYACVVGPSDSHPRTSRTTSSSAGTV